MKLVKDTGNDLGISCLIINYVLRVIWNRLEWKAPASLTKYSRILYLGSLLTILPVPNSFTISFIFSKIYTLSSVAKEFLFVVGVGFSVCLFVCEFQIFSFPVNHKSTQVTLFCEHVDIGAIQFLLALRSPMVGIYVISIVVRYFPTWWSS